MKPEHFEDTPISNPVINNQADMAALANEKLTLVVTPMVATINSLVDNLNGLSTTVYNGCVSMSKSIGGKVKEYAETMKTYNKSADDCQGLETVSVNQVHKKYIDDLVKKHDPLYNTLVTQADNFYTISYEDQDIELIKALTEISKVNSKLTPLIDKKVNEMLS
jgi:hypothetical protein